MTPFNNIVQQPITDLRTNLRELEKHKERLIGDAFNKCWESFFAAFTEITDVGWIQESRYELAVCSDISINGVEFSYTKLCDMIAAGSKLYLDWRSSKFRKHFAYLRSQGEHAFADSLEYDADWLLKRLYNAISNVRCILSAFPTDYLVNRYGIDKRVTIGMSEHNATLTLKLEDYTHEQADSPRGS